MMKALLRANFGVQFDLISHELVDFCYEIRFYDLIHTKPSLILLPAQHFQLQATWGNSTCMSKHALSST